MTSEETVRPTRVARVGWGILLLVSALMLLNGPTWFFVGPRMSVSYAARVDGVPVEEFIQGHPQVVDHLRHNARQVAIWYGAFGLMAFICGLHGLRTGARWAWFATWVEVAAPIAIGLSYLGDELSWDNLGGLAIGGLGLVGQLMAWRGLRRSR
jgi:hypothetical protein